MKGTEFYLEKDNEFIHYTEEEIWLSKGDVFYYNHKYYIVLFKMYIVDYLEDCKLKIILTEK